MAKIIHYRNKCVGCGICYEMQPTLWRMSKKDGKAVLLQASVKKDIHILAAKAAELETVHRVVEACPVKVIKIS